MKNLKAQPQCKLPRLLECKEVNMLNMIAVTFIFEHHSHRGHYNAESNKMLNQEQKAFRK